jgi:hypothetical protein
MKQKFLGWAAVAAELRGLARRGSAPLNGGQRASLDAIAERITAHGLLIGDEVGMGKTRIAAALADCVMRAGGRVAILVPPGLGYQWQAELRSMGREVPDVLRNLDGLHAPWRARATAGQMPWFDQPAVLVSHYFCRWHGDSDRKRHALLPELYTRWAARRNQRPAPARKPDDSNARTAHAIVEAVPLAARNAAYKRLDEMLAHCKGLHLRSADAYREEGMARVKFRHAIGLGLGIFDLVLIDEAHKSRKDSSLLSRLVGDVILGGRDKRTVAITATPVELDISQWWNTLRRIDVDGRGCALLGEGRQGNPIDRYAEATQQLRAAWRSHPQVRAEYASAAQGFQQALAPYLLRRDKRQDDSVSKFQKQTGLPADSYRTMDQHILVKHEDLDLKWRRVVCAAEALSTLDAKRLRLTLGNGHGISNIIDQFKACEDDKPQREFDQANAEPGLAGQAPDDKRAERVKWWASVVAGVMEDATDGDEVLFEHPALLAAAKAIQDVTAAGGKVLVFGRYTKPMKALVQYLNACEMFARLESGAPWPHEKVHEGSGADVGEWPAVRVAFRHIHGRNMARDDETRITRDLKRQYHRLEGARERFRDSLIERLTEGYGSKPDHFFKAFERSVAGREVEHELATISRGMLNLRPDLLQAAAPAEELAATFRELLRAVTDLDDPDATEARGGDGGIALRWPAIVARLRMEVLRPESGFARLMNSGTKPYSRKILQQSFNRKASFPQVLVAQSLVGREGLNLHEQCRTVVLLHHEWNPAVVEQQIGRVDRVGSHWSKLLEQAVQDGVPPDRLPRIEVRSVIFEGTYDEMHWQVLQRRWEDLRAQLHGVPIPHSKGAGDESAMRIIAGINQTAPDFSP